jgi:hypothetical protein
LAVKVSPSGLVLAGGTFAACGGMSIKQRAVAGRINGSKRQDTEGSRGWFETDTHLPDPEQLAGRILHVQHGDGTTHGWTLERVENRAEGAKLYVREEPGFQIDAASRAAVFYQFPGTTVPGPHQFRVARIVRSLPGN